jgi:hypothetical protein
MPNSCINGAQTSSEAAVNDSFSDSLISAMSCGSVINTIHRVGVATLNVMPSGPYCTINLNGQLGPSASTNFVSVLCERLLSKLRWILS